MKSLLLAALLLMSANAWSCTCWGTASIEETIAIHPNLVEARALSVSRDEVTLQVTRVLKGTVTSSTIQVGQWMCYASLYPELMKPQHTYVLPLGEPARGNGALGGLPSGEMWDAYGLGPKEGQYEMPLCSDSGFELVDGRLYTFEQTTGAQRRLQLYGEYSHFLRWRPVVETATIMWLFLLGSLAMAFSIGLVLPPILLVLCVALVAMFVRLPPQQRRKLIVLIIVLPTVWVLIGLWGSLFRYPDLSSGQPLHDPGWQSVPPLIGLILYFSFAVIYIRRVPIARVFAAGYSLVNAYFAVTMCLLSLMAINGAMPR